MDPIERRLKIWELVIRGVLGALVTVFVGVIAVWGNLQLGKLQQQVKQSELRNARIQHSTLISNSQKELETNIATRLWEDLTEKFFPQGADVNAQEVLAEQMFRLRLTALNLQDIAINLKPFFEHLHANLSKEEDRNELRAIAQQIARRQAYRLAFEAGLDFGEITFTKDKTEELNLPPDRPTKITIRSIETDRVRVEVLPPYQQKIAFWITFFDMPLVDNIKIKAVDTRLTILLIDTEPDKNQASLRLVSFEPYMAADRFDIKEDARANLGELSLPRSPVSTTSSGSSQ